VSKKEEFVADSAEAKLFPVAGKAETRFALQQRQQSQTVHCGRQSIFKSWHAAEKQSKLCHKQS
jgi:hypothetical protein